MSSKIGFMAGRILQVVVMGLTALAACQRPVMSPEPAMAPVRRDRADAQGLLDASLAVLRRHLYTIDRLDRAEGVVVTHPETSQQFFEFWRKDVATAYDLLESTVTPTRRIITVKVGAVDGESTEANLRLQVTVQKQRLRSPERQYNASASALRIFSEELPGAAGERRITRADEYWYDLDRDSAFESYLLNRILAEAGLPAESAS